MDILFKVFLFFHFVGLGALLGAIIVEMRRKEKKINPVMFQGAGLLAAMGLALTAFAQNPINYTAVISKIIVIVVIFILLTVLNKKSLKSWHLIILFLLALLEIGLSVFWL